MKLSILIKDFLFHCEVERGLAAHTVDSYRHDLNQYAAFLPPSVSAARALKTDRLKSFLNDMTRCRELSANTVRRRLACLKSLTRFASQRYALSNPFAVWSPSIKKPKHLPRAIPRADVVSLLSPSNPKQDAEITFALVILGATGLRVSELCALTVRDISQCGETIRVLGKGSRDRVVYLTHEKVIREMHIRRMRRLDEGGERAPIFLNSRGNPMQPQTLRRRLHKYTADLGFKQTVTPHMFRHTAATLLIEQGADIRFVQRLLGHASIATTEIYTHVTNDALRRAMSKANTMGVLLGD